MEPPTNETPEIDTVSLAIDPPEARRGGRYRGRLTIGGPQRTADILFVHCRAADRSSIRHIRLEKQGDAVFSLECEISKDAHDIQRLNFRVAFFDREAGGKLYLRVVDEEIASPSRGRAEASPENPQSTG